MKKVFLLAALAVAAMTSCSKEDGNNETETSSGKLISMRAVVDKTNNNNNRAAGMSTDRFNSFYVLAAKEGTLELNYLKTVVYSSYDERVSGYTWNYSPKAYYPADGASLSFYAYAPVGDQNMTPGSMKFRDDNSGLVSFEYTVPTGSNKLAEDLLVSCVIDNKYSNGNPLKYTFNHALSAATFFATNDNSELVYVIHNISINNLKTTGTFTYDAGGIGEWESQWFGNDTYTAPIPASGVAVEPPINGGSGGGKLLNENDFMFIMPQPAPEWSSEAQPTQGTHVSVEFSVRDGSGNLLSEGNETRNFYITNSSPLYSDGFEAGKLYEFNFTFDAFDAVTMEVTTVKGWNE